jgi:energy-coupling factor transport system ATP-binding protein
MLSVSQLYIQGFMGNVGPVSFYLNPGDWVLVNGGVGTGKTLMLLALGGLIKSSKIEGEIDWCGEPVITYRNSANPQFVSYIPSRPDFLFSGITTCLWDEMHLFVDPDNQNTQEKISNIIAEFDLQSLLNRDPFSLSGGERTRAAFAIAISQQPKLLLIDQATEWLDSETRDIVNNALSVEKSNGLIIIEATTRRELVKSPSLRINLYSSVPRTFKCNLDTNNKTTRNSIGNNSIRLEEVGTSYITSNFHLGPISFNVGSGERVAILGANGAGKTTLLRTIGLLQSLEQGHIKIEINVNDACSTYNSSSFINTQHKWSNHVLYCFQEPDDQLFCATVKDEILFTSLKIGSIDPYPIEQISNLMELEPYLDSSPLALPRGLRKFVLMASLIMARPAVLLLDEPTAGLDMLQIKILINVIKQYTDDGGICLYISHDAEFNSLFATRQLLMINGKIKVNNSEVVNV